MTTVNPGPDSGSLASMEFLAALAEHWKLLRLRGVIAIAFGLVVFYWPDLTVPTLTFLWAAYALVDGVVSLWGALTGKTRTPRLLMALIGLTGIASSLVVFVMPETIGDWLVVSIAAWAAVTGVMQVWSAGQLRKAVNGEWILALDGAMTVLFGVALIIWPHLEFPALVWLVGWFAILLGALYFGVAVWLRDRKADH
jgi:uncharacterized membrane protein HdeD (DUF308 family)